MNPLDRIKEDEAHERKKKKKKQNIKKSYSWKPAIHAYDDVDTLPINELNSIIMVLEYNTDKKWKKKQSSSPLSNRSNEEHNRKTKIKRRKKMMKKKKQIENTI